MAKEVVIGDELASFTTQKLLQKHLLSDAQLDTPDDMFTVEPLSDDAPRAEYHSITILNALDVEDSKARR